MSRSKQDPSAARHVRALLQAGRLGPIRSFTADVGRPPPAAAKDPAFWERGVLAERRGAVLGLLDGWLGPLTPISCQDDGHGGVEAEAILRLATADGAVGVVRLSRLRALSNSVTVTGEAGRVTLDLDQLTLTAEPPSLLDGTLADAAPDTDPTGLVAACRALREPLAHPWEAPGPTPAPKLLAGRKVLVTGATGFIGARLVEKLVTEQGAEVTVAVRNFRRVARIARFPIRMVQADLRDPAEVDALVQGQDAVFSLAYDFSRPGADNVAVHRTLADACTRAGVRRFVHVSSIAVYDGWPTADLDETSPTTDVSWEYKAAKIAIEADLRRRAAEGSLSPVMLQPTIVYGPFSGQWTDQFVEQLRSGAVILPDQGLGPCNGVYVDDVAEALIAAAAKGDVGGEAFIVSGARPFAWTGLLAGYAEAIGRPEALAFEPAAPGPASAPRPSLPSRLLASPLARRALTMVRDALGEDRIERIRARLARKRGSTAHRPAAGNPPLWLSQGTCSIHKAKRRLDFEPGFDLGEGLARTQAYIRWRYRSED